MAAGSHFVTKEQKLVPVGKQTSAIHDRHAGMYSNEPLMKFDVGHFLKSNVSCACCATHEVTRMLQCR